MYILCEIAMLNVVAREGHGISREWEKLEVFVGDR